MDQMIASQAQSLSSNKQKKKKAKDSIKTNDVQLRYS
jgi:hypothetical protein